MGRKLGSKLMRLGMLTFFIDPRIPLQFNDKQEYSECASCLNRGEKGNMCDARKRFPSGMCGKYEDQNLDTYNYEYGPRPEGMEIIPPWERSSAA